MRISIVNTKGLSTHAVQSITQAAQRLGVAIEQTDLADLTQLEEWTKSLGEVVIFCWAKAVKNARQRGQVFEHIRQHRILLNQQVIDDPNIRRKDWQQQHIAEHTSLAVITTLKFATADEWQAAATKQVFTFPLIQKPRVGVMGYYFLKINIFPQWREFERVTKVDVGQAIVQLCQQRYDQQ